MSLVEDALRKQQAMSAGAAKRPPAPAARPARSTTSVERVALGDPGRRRVLDHEALRRAGLLPPPSEEREIAHQFRSIKRPLIESAFGSAPPKEPLERGQRSIMVTSALPGDGKTFTSLNLALSLALERDSTVILVDGDMPKPHISELFNATNEPGLLDVLQNPALGIDSVILPTDTPGLSVVPVGRQVANATELLASARMFDVIRELESLDPHVIVVFDSPPLLLTSESRVLAGLFAQVLMVVRAGGTPQQAVLDAVKLLGEGPHVSLVLNQALHVGQGGYYGYGSGYGYGANPPEEPR